MLLSPNADYVSFRASQRDPNVATASLLHRTPPRSSFGSPLLTPSPLCRRGALLTPSPFRRPAQPPLAPMHVEDIFHSPLGAYTTAPPPDSSMVVDDDEEDPEGDDLFTGPPSASSSRIFPPSSPVPFRTPLRTPVKHMFAVSPERQALSIRHLNAQPSAASAGVKRKPTPICSTPVTARAMTPLNIASAVDDSLGFDRLAAPRFSAHATHNRNDTEVHLKKQAETMTMLRIRDFDDSSGESGYDSGTDTKGRQRSLYLASAAPGAPTARSRTKGLKGRRSGPELLVPRTFVADDEVAEAISPGGHITKRRARTRPVSAELREAEQRTPIAVNNQVSCVRATVDHKGTYERL